MTGARGRVPGGDLERAVLGLLWEHGPSTARELFDEIRDSRDIVYTTVAKVLDRLLDKGMVRRRKEGRAYRYHAVARQAVTQRAMARRLIERLNPREPAPAVAALLGAIEDVSPEMLDELAAEITARKKRG